MRNPHRDSRGLNDRTKGKFPAATVVAAGNPWIFKNILR
jgi:hypothetical protein